MYLLDIGTVHDSPIDVLYAYLVAFGADLRRPSGEVAIPPSIPPPIGSRQWIRYKHFAASESVINFSPVLPRRKYEHCDGIKHV
jgi:hypothetical protein